MFERFLTDALTKNFGHIIENLDADKVRLSTWDGEVHLAEVNLRKDAFDNFVEDCPVEIAYGHVGKLALRIPWKLVRSQLWRAHQTSHQLKCEVVLSDVNVLITPRRRNKNGEQDDSVEEAPVDPVDQESQEQQDKERGAQSMIDAELLRRVAESSQSSSRWRWIQERLAGILASLSVTLENIHIRYEDPGSSMGFVWDLSCPGQRYRSSFAIGLTLKQFSILSHGEDEDEAKVVDESSQVRHKTAAAERLAIYWDTCSRIMSNRAPLEIASSFDENDSFRQAFNFLNNPANGTDSFRERRSPFPSRRTYLLDPFSPIVRFALATESSNNCEPHVRPFPSTVSASFPPCRISVSRGLLEDLGYLRQSARVWRQVHSSSLSKDLIRRLSGLRPSKSPSKDPRGWWKYAYQAVHLIHRNDKKSIHYKGWSKLVRATTLRRRYLDIYRSFWVSNDEKREVIHHELIEAEQEFTVDEIVQFRIYACQVLLSEKIMIENENEDENPIAAPQFSAEDRRRRFREIAEALSRVEVNENEASAENGLLEGENSDIVESKSSMSWQSNLDCSEIAIQVQEFHESRSGRRPRSSSVVRASFSFRQEQDLLRDGSWAIRATVSDLVVKDCTHNGSARERLFPTLLRRKPGVKDNNSECISLGISRKRRWIRGQNRGSTTSTTVNVRPLEIVYATDPVERLARIFNSVQVDLADDYQRMASRLYEWREQQKRRLIAALSHKEKVILVDLQMGAPTLLVPEKNATDSPLLVFDLGRLSFSNNRKSLKTTIPKEERWDLHLNSIQLLCSRTDKYALHSSTNKPLSDSIQHVIEPFSLSLAVTTTFTEDSKNSISVEATLPKLIVNITASVCHLVARLKSQWKEKRLDSRIIKTSQNVPVVFTHQTNHVPSQPQGRFRQDSTRLESASQFQFAFAAPFLNLTFDNDVVPRSRHGSGADSQRFLDLTFRGLEGVVTKRNEVGSKPSSLTWTAKMNSVDVVDLYQTAGDSFSHLLSSIAPEFQDHSRVIAPGTEMVVFEYSSDQSPETDGYLSVRFHELYVEWNPETLAALHVALRPPVVDMEILERCDTSENDTFFDAEEEDFFDADSDATSVDSAEISEIASSRHSSFADASQLQNRIQLSSLVYRVPLLSPSPKHAGISLAGMSPIPIVKPSTQEVEEKKPFVVVLSLSKVRISFNKEARHRRVFVTEMDTASCEIFRVPKAGSRIKATIGNLVFSDPVSQRNGTLYREFLGLKTDSKCTADSLLELEIVSKPRLRCYDQPSNVFGNANQSKSVCIDPITGTVEGEDLSIKARLSPMRFVYLQQLWFETIDYFFEGIIGYEVWGGSRPQPVSALAVEPTVHTADCFSFLSLDVSLEAPMVLVPITYCSTNYLQVDLDHIHVENYYQFLPMRRSVSASEESKQSEQWFNNVLVKMENWKLRGWNGSRLNSESSSTVSSSVLINWPTGPTATLNVPKWKVSCEFDSEMKLCLLKDDFALFQHIVGHNLGEPSRHRDEWEALLDLPSSALRQYQQSIHVHFGYDKKDGTPTTFDVSVGLPQLELRMQSRALDDIAVLRSMHTTWTYLKLPDLIGRQKLKCALMITGLEHKLPKTLLCADGDTSADQLVVMTYSSVSSPSRDNTKTLDIVGAQILVHFEAWQNLMRFFQSLPSPTYLSPSEVIQVGDRWYKLGGSVESTTVLKPAAMSFSWLPNSRLSRTDDEAMDKAPSFGFCMKLQSPSVVLGNTERQVVLSMSAIEFNHHGQGGKVERRFDLKDMEVRVLKEGKISNRNQLSLIQPWCVSGLMHLCNNNFPSCCELHTTNVHAEVLTAQATFSDLVVASNVCLDLHRTMKAVKEQSTYRVAADNPPAKPMAKESICSSPKQVSLRLKGLILNVVDDSGRHFADSQEIVRLELSNVSFTETKTVEINPDDEFESTLEREILLQTLTLVDCLQSPESPFRSLVHFGEASADNSESCESEQALRSKLCTTHSEDAFFAVSEALKVQYNPSIIIALQRFLGRLRKEIDVTENDNITLAADTDEPNLQHQQTRLTRTLRASIQIKCAAATLNKEHQGRSLAKFLVRTGHFSLLRTDAGISVTGKVGFASIEDVDSSRGQPLPETNRVVLRASSSGDFLQFTYRTFLRQKLQSETDLSIPPWVQHQLATNSVIDDFLEVKMSTFDLIYLSERTKELVDYLSNGLPGRGMGATTRAAKGFVETRIEKRSFLQLQVEAPVVIVPQSECTDAGFRLGGDLILESWVEAGDVTIRQSAFTVKNFLAQSYDSLGNSSECNLLEDLDVNVTVIRRPEATSLKCTIPELRSRMAYTDYLLCQRILRHNVGRKINKTRWDNLESAWEMETSGDAVYSRDIKYSDNARHVRYGNAGKTRASETQSDFSVEVHVGIVDFVLRRNDSFHETAIGYAYDLAAVRLVGTEFSGKRCTGEGKQGSLSVKKFALKDHGEQGRVFRDTIYGKVRTRTYFSTIVEGYTPLSDGTEASESPQLLVSVDCPVPKSESENTSISASVVVNFLRVTALLTPIREISEFFQCRWPSSHGTLRETVIENMIAPEATANKPVQQCDSRGFTTTVRFVLHYPQAVFIADESNEHSKALVLSGLAIVNGSIKTKADIRVEDQDYRGSETVVKADFQNMSSFVYSDIAEFSSQQSGSENGVALLLPLTLGIDFEAQEVDQFHRKSLALSVEKIAVVLTKDDLQILSSLQQKLTRRGTNFQSSSGSSSEVEFDLVFKKERLGLGLRCEGSRTIVESTDDERVAVGDRIQSINGVPVGDSQGMSAIVGQLQSGGRPLTIGFIGSKSNTRKKANPASIEVQAFLDVSVSNASVALADTSVQLLRGELCGTRLQLRKTKDTRNLMSSFSASSTVEVDYFNHNVDEWEPALEASFISCSIEDVHDLKTRNRELSVEAGDRETGPILINATDASLSVIEKATRLLLGEHEDIGSRTNSNDAFANAALLFAKRQATHTRSLSAQNVLEMEVDKDDKNPRAAGECSLVVRNMLPIDLECQVTPGENGKYFRPGEVSVFDMQKYKSSAVRFRYHEWSPWYTVEHSDRTETSDIVVLIEQPRGTPVSFSVRVDRGEPPQIQLFLFAELWLLNITNLKLSFGAPRSSLSREDSNDDDAGVSAAEAALKEISALFDSGEEFPDVDETGVGFSGSEIVPMPAQMGASVTEEVFEYIKVKESLVKRRWWGGEYSSPPNSAVCNRYAIDSSWSVDTSGDTLDGWESSASLAEFKRMFSPKHKYRRRRHFRKRVIEEGFVNGFHHSLEASKSASTSSKQSPESDTMVVAMQIDGGKWSVADVPRHGKVYGAMRIASQRWQDLPGRVFEVCYSISPLDGKWGDVSRLLLVSPRFHLQNSSKTTTFEVKQTGEKESEETVITLAPGEVKPFHWTSSSLPELVSVRPSHSIHGKSNYTWSGGFDPVTIGAIPLRIRSFDTCEAKCIRTLKMEAEIRPKSGGTGINISFVEEQVESGQSLYRIENLSPFNVWISQDGVLSNGYSCSEPSGGDLLRPLGSCAFGLDVPFRQGKYSGRKAASMDELVRLRLSLGPQVTREGIETTKVLQFSNAGATVRLNPSKLTILAPSTRKELQAVRILGVVFNDGPTRVLRLSLVRQPSSVTNSHRPSEARALTAVQNFKPVDDVISGIHKGAEAACQQLNSGRLLPLEEEVVAGSLLPPDQSVENDILGPSSDELVSGSTVISLRLAFSGLVLSIVDSTPAEIALIALRNVNAIASWNTPRTKDSTVYVTVEDVQVDNMIPNAPYPITVCKAELESNEDHRNGPSPLLVAGLSFAPVHKSGIVCLKSVTIAPRNLAIRVDLAFLVRLQKFAVDAKAHFEPQEHDTLTNIDLPDLVGRIEQAKADGMAGVDNQKFYFGGLTILPCNIMLSVAPARALTPAQAIVEGDEASAIHQAVRKGDVKLGDSGAPLGVKIGSRNKTPLAVARGVLKSIVVDALLRLDGASLNFAGVSLRNHVSTGPQLATHIGAHYLSSLRQNVPALLASMAAFGNPLGLVRGLGDGVSDFVLEPVKGFQRSVQELDASYLVDGVARGTVSLARHTVGGFADSAASLTETFSKNMTVLTLDRRYAQKRDRGENLRNMEDVNVAFGLGSGVQKLVQGFLDGVTGVVRAPIRGANKRGVEGFAKGIGKGLLGLLVKPVIGISDGITDFMIGVKASLDGAAGPQTQMRTQIRPRRAIIGKKRILRPYKLADAAAQALLLRTRLAGEYYLGHVDMGDHVALLGVRRMVLLGPMGQEMLVLRYKHIDSLETRQIQLEDGSDGWGLIVLLNIRRQNNADMEVVTCRDESNINELHKLLTLAKSSEVESKAT